ncbi:diaminopimelate epimerase [Hahella sp. CR1]|uniref:diaminopimelate epimerase n=1 Tax=Hahella sp. CR1 TaxID=2992807 RepID=UPI0024416AB8|nr:diaminopimelate epimerase [Hahella sp. CR1]MDG9670530.1 diaminopimelate epimerase [Hahella sp. CR1]
MFIDKNETADVAAKTVPFVKYTSCGNNFVIVDATEDSVLAEMEWSAFAPKATSTTFGIGCDNLLVVQRSNARTLDAIAKDRNYWDAKPDLSAADYVFRMFEPNGEEAACCGNGLICIADFLRRKHGVTVSNIATEIPLSTPNIISIGSLGYDGSWVNLGMPRHTPTQLVNRDSLHPLDDTIDVIEELTIQFRRDDLKPYTDESTLTIKGYLVFTGEPHLVIFPDHDFSVPELANFIFGATPEGHAPEDRRRGLGAWLVHRIGSFINSRCRHIFPEGVSVNFARIHNLDSVSNRCFERGINRETLACSTGALAVAYVVQQLFSMPITNINLLPIRCREEDPDAVINIQQTENGWVLTTKPYMLFEGQYRMQPINVVAQSANEYLMAESEARLYKQQLTLEAANSSIIRKRLMTKQ